MREVNNFSGKIPPGFKLMEDMDGLYLFYGEKRVATFSATGADPKEIEKEAEKYLETFPPRRSGFIPGGPGMVRPARGPGQG